MLIFISNNNFNLTMPISLARAMLNVPASDSSWPRMLESQIEFIWDEYGEEVADWNKLVAAVEGLPEVDAEGDDDGNIFYSYRERSVLVPFEDEPGDALIGIHTLAQLVKADSELRFCRDSWGSSDVAFLALAPAQWQLLEQEYGRETVALRFLNLDADLEVFSAAASAQPGVEPVSKPVWTAPVSTPEPPAVEAFVSAVLRCVTGFYPGKMLISDVEGDEVSISFDVSTDMERAEMQANADLSHALDAIVVRARGEGVIVKTVSVDSWETFKREKVRDDRSHSLISV